MGRRGLAASLVVLGLGCVPRHRAQPALPRDAAGRPEPRAPIAPRLAIDADAPGPWLAWPIAGGVVSSGFGTRNGAPHEGIDIAAPEGTDVLAAAAGVVVYSGRMSGYGNIVIVKHEDGLLTVYAHNSRNLVRAGDRLRRGETLARVGQTGRATGSHLHFEVRKGEIPRDPRRYLEPNHQ